MIFCWLDGCVEVVDNRWGSPLDLCCLFCLFGFPTPSAAISLLKSLPVDRAWGFSSLLTCLFFKLLLFSLSFSSNARWSSKFSTSLSSHGLRVDHHIELWTVDGTYWFPFHSLKDVTTLFLIDPSTCKESLPRYCNLAISSSNSSSRNSPEQPPVICLGSKPCNISVPSAVALLDSTV